MRAEPNLYEQTPHLESLSNLKKEIKDLLSRQDNSSKIFSFKEETDFQNMLESRRNSLIENECFDKKTILTSLQHRELIGIKKVKQFKI